MDDCHRCLPRNLQGATNHQKNHQDARFLFHQVVEHLLGVGHELVHRDRLDDLVRGLWDDLHQEVEESDDQLLNGVGHLVVEESVDRSDLSTVVDPVLASAALNARSPGTKERFHVAEQMGRAQEAGALALDAVVRLPGSPADFSPLGVLALARLEEPGAQRDPSVPLLGRSRQGLDVELERPQHQACREDPRTLAQLGQPPSVLLPVGLQLSWQGPSWPALALRAGPRAQGPRPLPFGELGLPERLRSTTSGF